MQEMQVRSPGSGRSPGVGKGNPVQYFLPVHFHGQRSLVGYSPGGCKRVGHEGGTGQELEVGVTVCRLSLGAVNGESSLGVVCGFLVSLASLVMQQGL